MNFFLSFKKPYISGEYHDAIRLYQYKSSDSSISYKYCMSPLCDYIVKFFPMWLAPNVITVTGFFFEFTIFQTTTNNQQRRTYVFYQKQIPCAVHDSIHHLHRHLHHHDA